MAIQVVGAGLYRTGTKSLKAALEMLLGRPSYHMAEVFAHPEHVPMWHNAALGKMPNWHGFLKDYDATLDAPAAYFWPEAGERAGMMIFDMSDPAEIPKIAEQLFLNLDAAVEFTPVMNADDLQRALAAVAG